MSLSLRLAWRYLWGRRLRAGLTLLAVVLAVMIAVAMQGILPAVQASFDTSMTSAIHAVDLILRRDGGELFSEDVAAAVRDTPGVAAVTAVLEQPLRLTGDTVIATSDGGAISSLVVNGVDPATAEAVIPLRPVEGRWIQPGDERVALVRASLVCRTGLRLGDTLRLPGADGPVAFTIVGVLPARPVAGDEEVMLALADVQALSGLPGRINAVTGQFAAGQDAEALREAIRTGVGPGYTAGSVSAGGDAWAAALRLGEAAFALFAVLALAMAGFIMLNTFRTSVAERRRDIALLRAVGAERRVIIRLLLAESLLLGVVGTALGALAGVLLVSGLLAALGPTWARFFGAPLGAPSFAPGGLLLSVGLGLVVPLLAGLLPALAAGRVSPLEALRPRADEAVSARVSRRRLVAGGAVLLLALAALLAGEARLATGGALLALAALVVLSPALVTPAAHILGGLLIRALPREGRIARGNLLRNPERAAVTASSIMISLAILVALAGLTSTFTRGLMGYLEQSMRADYLVLPEALVLGAGDVAAGPELAERLRAVPGIAEVTTLRRATAQAGGAGVQAVGIDPQSYPRVAGLVFSAGDPAEAYTRVGRGEAIVNGVLAAQLQLVPGGTVTLDTPAGPRSYTVAAVGLDYLNARQATVYLSHNELAGVFGERRDALLMANRAPGASSVAVEEAIREVVRAEPGFSLLVYEQWRAEQLAGNQTRSAILYALMAILALPSLIALANTLGVNVLERTRELGVLRAVGGTGGQVQRMIVAESLLLASLGVAGGVLMGAVLGYALVGAVNAGGLVFDYAFPIEGALLALVVGGGFSVLAAALPARRAARMDIISALRYE